MIGYSFSDEHLNEIIFQGLRSNNRLAVAALVYGDVSKEDSSTLILPEALLAYGQAHRNLSLYGPDRAVIGGIVGSWAEPSRTKKQGELWPFWAESQRRFTLGDFGAFAEYLESYIGFRVTPNMPEAPLAAPAQKTTEATT